MTAFRIIFILTMLLFPVAFTWFYRARGESVDRDLLRRRRIRLHVASAVALAVMVVLWLGAHADWFAHWAEIPRFMTWSDTPADLGWIMFFPLWFGLAMPVIVAARPEMAGPHVSSTAMRTATLSPRTATIAVPRSRWLLGWAIWTCGFVVIGISAAAGDSAGRCILGGLFLIGGGLPPLLVTPWALRRLPEEPEPLDRAGSPCLVEAYARHREAKARGFAALAIATVMVFTTLASAVVLWSDRPAMVGMAGGVGGTLLGICGAVFGVKMSHDRVRIRRRLEELSRGG